MACTHPTQAGEGEGRGEGGGGERGMSLMTLRWVWLPHVARTAVSAQKDEIFATFGKHRSVGQCNTAFLARRAIDHQTQKSGCTWRIGLCWAVGSFARTDSERAQTMRRRALDAVWGCVALRAEVEVWSLALRTHRRERLRALVARACSCALPVLVSTPARLSGCRCSRTCCHQLLQLPPPGSALCCLYLPLYLSFSL